MSDDLAQRARKLIEQGIGAGDVAVLEALVAADMIEHQRGNNPGVAGAKAVARTLHRWLSDFSLTVDALVVTGDTVWIRSTARGVNTGKIMGTPPSGRPVELCVIDVVRFADGQVVEHWGAADQLGLLLQVGALPLRAGSPGPQAVKS